MLGSCGITGLSYHSTYGVQGVGITLELVSVCISMEKFRENEYIL